MSKKKSRRPVSTTFDAAADKLEKLGLRDISKARFGLDPDGNPWRKSNERIALDADVELGEQEWWVPVGFDGEYWRVRRCLPPWTSDDNGVRNKLSSWIQQSESETEILLADDPEEFVRDELSAMLAWAGKEGRLLDKGHHADRSLRMLRESLEAASRVCNRYPRPKTADPIDELPLDLPDDVWRAIGCAYRAGRSAERVGLHFRGIPEMARKGKVWADNEGKGRPKKEARMEEDLKDWEQRVVQALRKLPKPQTTTALMEALEKGGFLQELAGGKLKLSGERKGMAKETFRKKIRALKTDFVSKG